MNINSYYKSQNANDNSDGQRRRFPRRDQDTCMINVDGHPYPVIDWSQCGVLFEGDSRLFEHGQKINMILRFKINNKIEDIKVTGEVVRKNSKMIATTFNDVPQTVMQSFDKIIKTNVA